MWTDELYQITKPIWDGIQAHPFVQGIGDGTLPLCRFAYFIGQDYVYLQDFSQVLAMGAARATCRADEPLFLRHAGTVHAVEAELHRDLAPSLGLEPKALLATTPGPVTVAYTDHLMRAAWTRPYPVLVASVLPCYWIYREVGRKLALKVPEHPQYRAWIETYAGDAYGQAVEEMLGVANRLQPTLSPSEEMWARRAFWRSCRYEWLFWEQAWSLEQSLACRVLPSEPSW